MPIDAQTILERLGEAVIALDAQMRVTFWNAAAEEMSGCPAPEALGRSFLELARRPDRGGTPRAQVLASLAEHGFWKGELVYIRPDGGEIVVDASARRLDGPDGRVEGYVGVAVDAGPRRISDAALRRSEEQIRFQATLLDHVSEAVVAIDDARRVLFWSRGAERTYGWSAAEALGRSIDEVLPRMDGGPEARTLALAMAQAQGSVSLECVVAHRGGRLLTVDVSTSRVRDAADRPLGYVSVARDVSERRRVQRALEESEERYRALVEASPVAAFVHSEGIVRYVNPAAMELLGAPGPEALVGREILSLVHPDDLPAVRERQRVIREEGRGVPVLKERLVRCDGGIVVVEVIGVPFRFGEAPAVLALARDITDRERAEESLRRVREEHEQEKRRLEERILHAQKMEAVGRLAGGVAHDFNNLLTVINGFTDMALAGMPARDPLVEPLGEVRKAGERAAALTRQLLAFSRKQHMEPRLLDLNGLVSEDERMLRRIIGEDVALVSLLAPVPLPVLADPAQVEQIVMNLAINARDAMPRGGTLTLRTQLAPEGPPAAAPGEAPVTGDCALLEVADTGCGMTPEVRERLFEPFFTTKGHGKGTGLGLSTVYGIVRQSGGQIDVESEPGNGTTFRIWLPLAREGAAPTPSPEPRPIHPGARERILVVEDEPSVRGLVREVLVSAGYEVEAASGAQEARALFARENGAFDLLLTDAVMPGANGSALAAELTALAREMKVLLMSGYVEPAQTREAWPFLAKPFSPERLTRKVRETLRG